MELASGSGSASSRSLVKDQSGYQSGHNEDALSKFLPGASLGKAQGWMDRGIATTMRPEEWVQEAGLVEEGRQGQDQDQTPQAAVLLFKDG